MESEKIISIIMFVRVIDGKWKFDISLGVYFDISYKYIFSKVLWIKKKLYVKIKNSKFKILFKWYMRHYKCRREKNKLIKGYEMLLRIIKIHDF